MQPSGNLSDISLPSFFHKITLSKGTGVLRLTQGKMIKEIYFLKGRAVYVKSNILSETLGRVLLEKGLLSQDTYDISLRIMQETKKPHGTILKELGALKVSLEEALQTQMEYKLITSFQWKDGTYSFRSLKELPQGIEHFELSTPYIVLHGVKSSVGLDELMEKLSGYMEEPMAEVKSIYSLQDFGFTPEEEEVFHLIDGKRTVKDILEMSKLGLQDTLGLIYALILLELVCPASLVQQIKKEAPAPQPYPVHEEALKKPGLTPDDIATKNKLEEKLSTVRGQNYFQMLGISSGAPIDHVKKAYYKLAREYHPDHYYDKPEEIRSYANDLFTLITQAHAVLTNNDERKKYEEFLRTGKTDEDIAREAQNVINAEIAYQKGIALLKKGDIKGAEEQLRRACDLKPNEAEYHVYYGWTLFRLTPAGQTDFSKAKEFINKGLTINGSLAQGHYFLGMIYKREGREAESRESYKKALECNPDHVEALREIRLIAMREGKEDKGIFGKLFK